MINKNITKIFNKKNKQRGRNFGAHISDPKYAWNIIVCMFVVINISLMAFSGYLFLKISSGDIFKIESDVSVMIDTIDRTLLRDTLEVFEKKEIELEELKKKRPSVIDPSF